MEQKNWSRVRELVGYQRYDSPEEFKLLNQIWELDRIFTNYLLPQHKLVSKTRHGAKVTQVHDRPTTPHQRAVAHPAVRKIPVIRLNVEFKKIRMMALSQQILELTGGLEKLSVAKSRAIDPAGEEGSAMNQLLRGDFHLRQRIKVPGGIDMTQQVDTPLAYLFVTEE